MSTVPCNFTIRTTYFVLVVVVFEALRLEVTLYVRFGGVTKGLGPTGRDEMPSVETQCAAVGYESAVTLFGSKVHSVLVEQTGWVLCTWLQQDLRRCVHCKTLTLREY